MRVLALSPSHEFITLDQFFSSEPEFLENLELADSVTRTLKTLLRHPQDVDYMARKKGSTYFLGFKGKLREYVLAFELGDDLLLLGLC